MDEALLADGGPFRVLFERSPEGMMLIDPSDPVVVAPIIACNDSAARMNGYSREELIGKPVSLLTRDPALHEELMKYVNRLRQEGLIVEEDIHYRKDGTTFPVEFSTVLVTIGNRELVLGVDRDISHRKMLEDAIAHQALHDSLTNLPNRAFLRTRLFDAIDEARDTNRSAALLFMDLDGFKDVNDSFGHHVGDELLTKVARRVKDLVGESGTVARQGGDEFAVVLPLATRSKAIAVISALATAFRDPFDLGGTVVRIGASVGCSLFPDHGADPTTLMRRADIAMYVAKHARLTGCIYSAELEETSANGVADDNRNIAMLYKSAG
jgi:diguanylate cyclase (GGDEF)-like protein/PAS domain S-box-containing protein